MSKRDTIIISVLVNAGLLVVLFFTAVTSREEVIGGATSAIASKMYDDEKSSYMETPKESSQELQVSRDEKPAMVLPMIEEKKEMALPVIEKELVHKLPPVAKAETAIAKQEIKSEFSEHIVKSGESLEKIARKYQLRISELKEMNHLKDTFLKIGQKLLVKQGEPKKQEEIASADGECYIVKTGDSPWTIAMKNHIKVDDLLRMNDLNEQKARKLKPGDKLRIR